MHPPLADVFLSLKPNPYSMSKIFQFIFLLLLLGCGTSQIKQTDAEDIPNGPAGVKGSVITKDASMTALATDEEVVKLKTTLPIKEFSNGDKVGAIMGFLASDELNGRDSGSPGIEKAAQYIEENLRLNGIRPYFPTFRDTLSNYEKPAYNIVGVLEGTDADLKHEFILIGAHYDHIGTKSPVDGDAIANGANDNASGTTTVLELMRYFAKARSNKRSLVFAFFSAEEKGLLGSKHMANRLKKDGFSLYTMLNFEMVGVPMRDKDYLAYVSGYEKSNLAEVCNRFANDNLVGFLPAAKEFNLFMRSDNYPFHYEFNVPSQTFSTFDFTNFDHYHMVGDEVSEMDFTHMDTLINRFIPIIEGITNTPQKEIKYN